MYAKTLAGARAQVDELVTQTRSDLIERCEDVWNLSWRID
jgi:hypothetical protein